ncbi:MAG: autotransporter outer membrane beta-barrel domain-containing protein, partial [Parvibaculaceae bacterium]
GFGGTLTWYGLDGFYADAQAQANWFDTDIKSDLTGKMADGDNSFGYGLSLEIGKSFAVGGPWALTPQAQLAYTKASFDFTDAFGADVSSKDDDSLLGRLGVALDYRNGWMGEGGPAWSNVYGIANLYHEFLGGTSVDVSGARFDSEPEDLWGGLGLGGTYSWGGDKYAVYGEASVDTSLDNFADSYSVNGKGGFRLNW